MRQSLCLPGGAALGLRPRCSCHTPSAAPALGMEVRLLPPGQTEFSQPRAEVQGLGAQWGSSPRAAGIPRAKTQTLLGITPHSEAAAPSHPDGERSRRLGWVAAGPVLRGGGCRLCSPREGMVKLGSLVHPTPPPRPAPSPPTSQRPNKKESCSRTAGAGVGGQLGAVLGEPGHLQAFLPALYLSGEGRQGEKRPHSAWAWGWGGTD